MDQPLSDPYPSIPTVPSSSPPPVSAPPHTSYVPKLLIVAVLFLTLGLGAGFMLNNYVSTPKPTLGPVFTTSLSPTPDPTANWKTYFDPNGLYTFRYPANYSLGHYGSDNSPLLLNNRIDWGVTQHPAGGCMGDCPIVANTQKVTIGGYSAILYEGWVGSIGGETPQSYIKYEIKQPSTDNYFVMTLWELDRTSEAQKNYSQERKIGVISEDDKKIFDQILSTFKFTFTDNISNGTICQKDIDCGNGFFCLATNCVKSCYTNQDCEKAGQCEVIEFFSGTDNNSIVSKKGCR